VYKEPSTTRLKLISDRLRAQYAAKLGTEVKLRNNNDIPAKRVGVVSDSNNQQHSTVQQ
jgi:hypothetical protein